MTGLCSGPDNKIIWPGPAHFVTSLFHCMTQSFV